MSTLPFLLSVADELDNLNSQSYMDDFGLGFHPHRQYYRSPTIQLSLPASTDWMQERQRCRTHKFVDDLQATDEVEENESATVDNKVMVEEEGVYGGCVPYGGASTSTSNCPKYNASVLNSRKAEDDNIEQSVQMYNLTKKCCKNYHRHGDEASAKEKSGDSYKLQTKCMEGNNSSSDESLQKVTSSIEFLTCFLVKKSRASKTGTGGAKKP